MTNDVLSVCPICKKRFKRKRLTQIYCSKECKYENLKKKNAEKYRKEKADKIQKNQK